MVNPSNGWLGPVLSKSPKSMVHPIDSYISVLTGLSSLPRWHLTEVQFGIFVIPQLHEPINRNFPTLRHPWTAIIAMMRSYKRKAPIMFLDTSMPGPAAWRFAPRERCHFSWSVSNKWPIGSRYGICTYICHKNQPNVGKYAIHGSFG